MFAILKCSYADSRCTQPKHIMAKYRTDLPQLTTSTFMTDEGLETDLIFNLGIELPQFAAFDLLKNDGDRERESGMTL